MSIYDLALNVISDFMRFSKINPGMALIILVCIMYFGDKLMRHFSKGKHNNYTLKETLDHPREIFGIFIMLILFIVGIIFLFQ